MSTGSEIPIILASTSPRRVDLMNQVHLKVEIQAPNVDEAPQPGEKPIQLVGRLAQEKAESIKKFAKRKYSTCLVIAADTIVVSPDGAKILGKPENSSEARKMLLLLAGKTHTVFTGYCILLVSRRQGLEKKMTRVVKSKVTMRSLTQKMIEAYISTGEPMDKAGAYGAQGLGTALIEKIEGSYTNVVGLPLSQMLTDLQKISKKSLFSWLK